jgi:diphthamide biosynthesis enzyme Dph1/Dph2-like protein
MSKYDLELEKAVEKIKETKAETVLVQLPDGLKPKFSEIVDHLEKETKAEIMIWMDSCFGSCDIPELKGIDLLIQWGHAAPSELMPKVTRDDE